MTSLSRSPRFPVFASAIFLALSAAIVVGAYTYHAKARRVVEEVALSEITATTEMKADELRHWQIERLADARSSRDSLLALEVDGLLPLLRRWPLPMRTSSCSLFLLRGDSLDYPSMDGRTLSWAAPVPAAGIRMRDSLNRGGGTALESDEQGNLFLGCVRRIPGTPWFLDARLDVDEIYRPIREQGIFIGLVAAFFVLGGWAAILLLWRRREEAYGITRRHEEMEHQAVIQHLMLITRYANDAMFLFRPDGSILECNDRAVALYGWSKAELQEMSLKALQAEGEPGHPDPLLDALQRGDSVTLETSHLRRDGTTFDVEIAGRTIVVQGKSFYQTIIRDISERRKAEESLKFSHFWVNSAGDAIFWYGAEGKILFVNSAVSRLTGYSHEELLLRTVRDLQAPLQESDRAARDLYLQSHGSVRYDTSLLRKDGAFVPVEMMETHLSYHGREYFCAVARDLTERKRAEEQIRRMNRMYAILSKVNEVIGRIGEPVELYREVCRIAVEEGGMASAAVFQRDGTTGAVQPVVWSGSDVEHLTRMAGTAGGADAGGPVGEAWRTGGLAVRSDIDGGTPSLRSVGCVPVRHRDAIVAVVALSSSVPDYFSGEERKLLSDLAVDVSFGIEYIEAERERRASAEILRMSEFTYRVLFDNNPRPMYVFEPETLRFLAVNATAVRVYGYSHDEFLRMTLLDIRPTEEIERFVKHVNSPAPSHGSMGIWRHRKKNGEVIDVEIFRHDFEFAGRPAKLVVASDITEQERLLVKLEGLLEDRDRILQRLQFQFEIMPIGCVVVDEQLTVVDWNPAASALFGYSKEEMVGQRKLDHLLPADARGSGAVFPGALASLKALVRLDVECSAKSGARRVCEWIVSPLESAQGRTIGVLAMVRDISLERRAQQEIRKLNEELEARVVLRTRQLENANRELEAFSYSISHDLRAPLRSIEGFTRILEEDHASALPDEAKRFLSLIRGSATKMNHLIDDLLGFSRVGRQALNAVPVDMTVMVREVIGSLPSDQQQVVILKSLPPTQGDPPLLRQVWFNLISNALKFSARVPHPVVVVESVTLEEEPVYVVRDNGAGFDMRYADKLFGVFQRLHAASEFDGTGVGLAIVNRVIQRHGGRVWAHGEPGKGATFYFTVPAGSIEGSL